jgi:hypothetical protein
LREQLGFHNPRPIRERQEFHGLARNLVVRALLHDQTTGRDGFPDEVAKPIHRAVAFPRHIGKQFQGVAATQLLTMPEQSGPDGATLLSQLVFGQTNANTRMFSDRQQIKQLLFRRWE